MKPSVLVLGCGPSGLIAAEAVRQWGHVRCIDVYSRKIKSMIFGAQYLHDPIPGVDCGQEFPLRYVKKGDARGYAAKVYGSPDAPVSWVNYREGVYPAWPLLSAYSALWASWERFITDTPPLNTHDLHRMARGYDLVISTIPAHLWCNFEWDGTHKFDAAHVYYASVAPKCPVDTIVYDGRSDHDHYRMSNIRGIESAEYPITAAKHAVFESQQRGSGLTISVYRGIKPTTTNCDCPPGNVIRTGRFGAWDKKYLTHHVYKEVLEALDALF